MKSKPGGSRNGDKECSKTTQRLYPIASIKILADSSDKGLSYVKKIRRLASIYNVLCMKQRGKV